ncbi:nitrite/sulfite reductase, partial [Pseudomonas aeruginosa]
AQGIQQRFADLDHLLDSGELSLNISGCMNACGHHHIGNIGILGVDKNGSEWYQDTLGSAERWPDHLAQRAVLALGAAEGDLVPLAA